MVKNNMDDKKENPNLESLGIFKLKDSETRCVIAVDLLKAKRPISEALRFYIVKIRGENNKIKVLIEWKPEVPPIPEFRS